MIDTTPTATITRLEVKERPFPTYQGRGSYGHEWQQYTSKPRVYVFPEGETIKGWLTDRWEQKGHVKLYRTLMPAVLEAMGVPATTKYAWSQKAGCSCGCSPGFIVEAHPAKPVDVFVTVG